MSLGLSLLGTAIFPTQMILTEARKNTSGIPEALLLFALERG